MDVVDASTADAWIWAQLVPRDRRPALVTRSHGLEHVFWRSELEAARAEGRPLSLRTRLYHGGWRLREVARSLRLADACVFTNHGDLEYAVTRLGVLRERCAVVLNGIPAEFAGRPVRPAPASGLTVATIGTWAARKGARHAASALTQLLSPGDARAVLLGTRTPPGTVLEAFPEPVRERVTVIPEYDRSELPDLLADAQVLLSASLAEGFSLALPEAMACGLAPVATDLPGAREVVRHDENGLLVPPGDSVALGRTLCSLARDRERLERLRRAAHATAQALTWRRMAEGNLAVYERARRERHDPAER